MDRIYGNESNKIWLIGDSAPVNAGGIRYPLDARHPTRHNIWTPILDHLQETLFLRGRNGLPTRLSSSALFVTNAVPSPTDKPAANDREWKALEDQLVDFRAAVKSNQPLMLLTFGAFSFEFCRRAIEGGEPRPASHWTAPRLGVEFGKRVARPGILVVPLLHASVARGGWLYCHLHFCDRKIPEAERDYFAFTGSAIAERLLEHHSNEDIWMGQYGQFQRPLSG